MIGLSAVDASYKLTPAVALFLGMLTIFTCMTAYTEYVGLMEGKLFAMYHYFLSAVVFFWQSQPTTTTVGALFFLPPHLFTAWTAYIVLTQDQKGA